MIDFLNSSLLWVLTVLGAWNGVGLIFRILYGEYWAKYLWSVVAGLLSAVILIFR